VDSADRDRTLAAPATRRVAREEGVELNAVPATEQRDGEAFVSERAVREYAQAQREAQQADTQALQVQDADVPAAQAADDAAASTAAEGERERRRPYRGVRRTIGERMSDSKFTAPHVTHHDTADATRLVETRERLKPEAEERGISLTYMPFVMKACVAALKEHPIVNAQLDEEAEEIVEKRYYNVGVATDTDAGLMVPVVDDVDRKGLLQVASETNELVQKARERSIDRSEMQGGTFTITNIGGIGGEYATPIINRPQVAILALGAIEQRPVVEDGEVVARHTIPLSLSIDHRVVDGADAARFTNTLKEYLEEPSLLLLE
ncbi:MAG TPA: 2-oxo acid dehydrogenase subunit E2, partial [Natronoarchaeum rubrum]|nr:2-oxo acid dehydrogenase subunit E2 [Natronoarchaeum rubrum]